jgi:hypothetical protein
MRTQTIRLIARWVKNRGYWPTIGELLKSKARVRRRRGMEFTAACRAIKANVLDAIEDGELMRIKGGPSIALTEKGWDLMPASYPFVEAWLPSNKNERNRVIKYRGFLKGYLDEAEKQGYDPVTLLPALRGNPKCPLPEPTKSPSGRYAWPPSPSESADGSSSESP